MIPNFCSPWSNPKVGKLILTEVGMCLAPGPLVFLISLLLQTGDWEAMEKGKTGKNYSTAGVCPAPIPWPLSGQQNLIMCELNLENSNAPALPEWTHTHTHTWDREVLLWEPWDKDQERLPRAALGLRSEGMNKWPDEKGVGWRGSERMFQTEQTHLPRAWWGVDEGRPESLRTGHCGWSYRGGWSLTWMSGQSGDPVCTDSVLPSVKQRIKGVRNEVLVVEGKWKKLRQTGCDSNQKCVSKSILKDRGRASH